MDYEEYDLVNDPAEIDRLEAENALVQYDYLLSLLQEHVGKKEFYLNSNMIQELNRIAVDRLHSKAGQYRTSSIRIRGSQHVPPPQHELYTLVEDLCFYCNVNKSKSPEHLAAYCLWRLSWIHPFWNGNGRTARALCYLHLCIGFDTILPGRTTVLAHISKNKQRYYRMLELADLAYSQGQVNFDPLESYLTTLLTRQLSWP